MRQAIQSTKFMQAIIVALIAGGMIFWIGVEMGKPAGREDLKVEVVDIRSNVSEAAKVIEAATYGRLTAKYFQITCAAEVGGIAIILRLILGWPYRALILIGFLFLLLSVWFLSFKWIERVFGLFGLLMTVFIVSAFYLRPDWGQVASSFIPHVPRVESRQEYYSYAYFVIALLSSIMLPYETYFYASGAIEDRWEPKHIKLNRVVVIIGFTLGSVLSAGLILIGAQMFLPTKLEPNLPGAAALGPAMTFGKTGLIVPLLVITHGGKE